MPCDRSGAGQERSVKGKYLLICNDFGIIFLAVHCPTPTSIVRWPALWVSQGRDNG